MYESDFFKRVSLGRLFDRRWAAYLGRIQHFYDAGVSQCPQLLQGVLGEWEGRSVGGDVEREDAAVRAVFLRRGALAEHPEIQRQKHGSARVHTRLVPLHSVQMEGSRSTLSPKV